MNALHPKAGSQVAYDPRKTDAVEGRRRRFAA